MSAIGGTVASGALVLAPDEALAFRPEADALIRPDTIGEGEALPVLVDVTCAPRPAVAELTDVEVEIADFEWHGRHLRWFGTLLLVGLGSQEAR